ncbi:helix-turn-helix domain-containing protein [Companilactobacillus mishanensis]|uniref:helix-turn-helix domain-containing protein n=1 Tax=Companilactobacillus mishanensis TaxID=2486008 RepID=UPI001297E93F|nr:helix-turn-helix transcriptional regulator [Companilactobacillus mishanensis]MQS89599.1 helix-turn-helix transcriptional regulator [Companilactobacillus mishanensis]
MSQLQDYINDRSAKNPQFAAEMQKQSLVMENGISLMKYRESLGLSRHKFAKLVGKKKSTIFKIESGEKKASLKLLNEIAYESGAHLEIQFIDNHLK